MTETATETSMRQGLASLAAEVAPRPPSLDELARRAETDSRPEGPSSRRKRTVAGLVVAGAVVIGTTGAAALGVVPGPVRDAFDTFRGHSDAYVLDPDEAELVRSAVGEDGRTVEYWIAPIDGGGTCEYVRYVEADGTNHQDGWSACSPDGNQLSLSPGLFVVASPSGDDQGVAGRAPEGTVTVRVRFDSGEADVSVDDDRYFIASFDRTERIQSVEAVDADGVVIDMTSYPVD